MLEWDIPNLLRYFDRCDIVVSGNTESSRHNNNKYRIFQHNINVRKY